VDVFKKVDLAIEALKNAEEKTGFAPPASNEDLARFNALLEEAKLPQIPVDFMYLLSKFGACQGPYVEIYGLKGLDGAQKPDDVLSIEYSLALNTAQNDDDDDPKALLLGRIPAYPPPGLSYDLVYKNGAYHHVEDDRGVLTYFQGPDNIGDFILKEMKTAKADKQRKEVEKWSD